MSTPSMNPNEPPALQPPVAATLDPTPGTAAAAGWKAPVWFKGVAPWLAVVIIASVAPFVFSDFWVSILSQTVVYAIAILGLNLLTGFNGQISIGHGAFYAVGAYTTAILLDKNIVPYWAAVPVSGAVCFVFGFLFGLPALRLAGIYLALATFALGVALPQILKLDALDSWTGGVQGLSVTKPSTPLESLIDDERWLYFFCLLVALILFIMARNLVRGRTGRALIAIRDHPVAAATMGVNLPLYKSLTFGVSAVYTGMAGALGALVTGFISPDAFTIQLTSIPFLVAVVVGGVASIAGTIFGAAFIELLPKLVEKVSIAAPDAIYGAVLIVCVVVMPYGVAGLARQGWARLVRAQQAKKVHGKP
jgi:branched-chain amino acid transport system permease protein